jgi:hypothetical protein
MDAPQESFYPEPRTETLMISFRIISRRSWDELQGWRDALPGSHIEHLMFGLYVLVVPPGGARRIAG